MVTSEKFNCVKVLTRFLYFVVCYNMVLVVSLCLVAGYQATSHMPVPMHNSSEQAWMQIDLMSEDIVEVVI